MAKSSSTQDKYNKRSLIPGVARLQEGTCWWVSLVVGKSNLHNTGSTRTARNPACMNVSVFSVGIPQKDTWARVVECMSKHWFEERKSTISNIANITKQTNRLNKGKEKKNIQSKSRARHEDWSEQIYCMYMIIKNRIKPLCSARSETATTHFNTKLECIQCSRAAELLQKDVSMFLYKCIKTTFSNLKFTQQQLGWTYTHHSKEI